MNWRDGKGDKVLRRMASQGATTLQVAEELGCTRGAIWSRAHKLKVRFRPSRENDGRRLNGPLFLGWRRKSEGEARA